MTYSDDLRNALEQLRVVVASPLDDPTRAERLVVAIGMLVGVLMAQQTQMQHDLRTDLRDLIAVLARRQDQTQDHVHHLANAVMGTAGKADELAEYVELLDGRVTALEERVVGQPIQESSS